MCCVVLYGTRSSKWWDDEDVALPLLPLRTGKRSAAGAELEVEESVVDEEYSAAKATRFQTCCED